MGYITIPKMSAPPIVGIYCIVCGKLAREEYFTGNIDVLVCDECKDAIAWAKEQMKKQDKTPVVFSQDDGSVTTACGNCGLDLDKAYSRCPKCQKELDWNALQE